MVKKISLVTIILIFAMCTSNENLDGCIQALPISRTVNLNNPEFINALVPGSFAEINGGSNGILLQNVNGNDFVAYDRLCPSGNCNEPMTFENGLVLKCPCDNSEYGVGFGIGGQPQTEGFVCPAIEYRVIKNGDILRITNF